MDKKHAANSVESPSKAPDVNSAEPIEWPFKVDDVMPPTIEHWRISGRPLVWKIAIDAAQNYAAIAKDLCTFGDQSNSYKKDTTAIARREKLITLLKYFYWGIEAFGQFSFSKKFYCSCCPYKKGRTSCDRLNAALVAYEAALGLCTGKDEVSYSGGLVPNESVLELFLYLKCASLVEKPKKLKEFHTKACETQIFAPPRKYYAEGTGLPAVLFACAGPHQTSTDEDIVLASSPYRWSDFKAIHDFWTKARHWRREGLEGLAEIEKVKIGDKCAFDHRTEIGRAFSVHPGDFRPADRCNKCTDLYHYEVSKEKTGLADEHTAGSVEMTGGYATNGCAEDLCHGICAALKPVAALEPTQKPTIIQYEFLEKKPDIKHNTSPVFNSTKNVLDYATSFATSPSHLYPGQLGSGGQIHSNPTSAGTIPNTQHPFPGQSSIHLES